MEVSTTEDKFKFCRFFFLKKYCSFKFPVPFLDLVRKMHSYVYKTVYYWFSSSCDDQGYFDKISKIFNFFAQNYSQQVKHWLTLWFTMIHLQGSISLKMLSSSQIPINDECWQGNHSIHMAISMVISFEEFSNINNHSPSIPNLRGVSCENEMCGGNW